MKYYEALSKLTPAQRRELGDIYFHQVMETSGGGWSAQRRVVRRLEKLGLISRTDSMNPWIVTDDPMVKAVAAAEAARQADNAAKSILSNLFLLAEKHYKVSASSYDELLDLLDGKGADKDERMVNQDDKYWRYNLMLADLQGQVYQYPYRGDTSHRGFSDFYNPGLPKDMARMAKKLGIVIQLSLSSKHELGGGLLTVYPDGSCQVYLTVWSEDMADFMEYDDVGEPVYDDDYCYVSGQASGHIRNLEMVFDGAFKDAEVNESRAPGEWLW